MKDKKTVLLIILGVVLVLGIGITYAYFTSGIITENQNDQIVTTGTLELTYEDGPEIILNDAYPGDYVTKTIKVKNTGTLDTSYTINWTKLINTITNNELVVSTTCSSEIETETGNVNGTCESINETVITSSTSQTNSTLAKEISIVAGETHTYELTITFKETGSDQNYNQGKHFSTVIQINEEAKLYTINGTLYNSSNTVIESATVKVSSSSDVTNETGNFTIENINSGTHDLIITDQTGDIIAEDEIIIQSGEEESVNGNTIISPSDSDEIKVDIKLNNSKKIEEIKYTLEPRIVRGELFDIMLADNNEQSDTAAGIDYTALANATEGNGNGLFYTTSNTEGNKTVYFYRGTVENNYLVFAGYCWRLVRTNEANNSVKMRYAGVATEYKNTYSCEVPEGTYVNIHGLTSYNSGSSINDVGYTYNGVDSDIKVKVDTWYTNNIQSQGTQIINTISNALYCNDRTYTTNSNLRYFGALNRLQISGGGIPHYKCPSNNDAYSLAVNSGGTSGYGNNLLTKPIALLTIDEAVYAGAPQAAYNDSFYLCTGQTYWTMSPDYYNTTTISDSKMYSVSNRGFVTNDTMYNGHSAVVPVLSIYGETKVSGNGLVNDPYVVEYE